MPIMTTRDQQQLHVRVIGHGQPVLVLSGLGMDSKQWLPFFMPYLSQFKFYIPDFRGFGGSAHTPFSQPDVFNSHMQDVEDVVEHFQLKDFLLIGYSLGATTGMHWMQHGNFSSQSIKRYLQIDQTPCIHLRDDWPYGLLGKQQAGFMDSLQQLLAILQRHPGELLVHDMPREDKQQLLAIWAPVLKNMTNKGLPNLLVKLASKYNSLFDLLTPFSTVGSMQAYLHAYLTYQHDYRQAIAAIDIPVTFFMGKLSLLYAVEGQQKIAESVKQHTVVVFEQSGHTPLFNEPMKFLKSLGEFLRQPA